MYVVNELKATGVSTPNPNLRQARLSECVVVVVVVVEGGKKGVNNRATSTSESAARQLDPVYKRLIGFDEAASCFAASRHAATTFLGKVSSHSERNDPQLNGHPA